MNYAKLRAGGVPTTNLGVKCRETMMPTKLLRDFVNVATKPRVADL